MFLTTTNNTQIICFPLSIQEQNNHHSKPTRNQERRCKFAVLLFGGVLGREVKEAGVALQKLLRSKQRLCEELNEALGKEMCQ